MGIIKSTLKNKKLSYLSKPSFASKIGLVAPNRRIMGNENYSLTYSIKGKSLFVNFFKKDFASNLGDLKKIYLDLLKISSENKSKRIVARTWFFIQKEEFAKKLGFNMVKGTDTKLKKILEKYPDYKIIGIDKIFLSDPSRYGENICLILKNRTLKKEVVVPITKTTLPVYVKEL